MSAKLFCSRACAFVFRTNDNHHAWKGSGASYSAIHKWVTKHFGKPTSCVDCKTQGNRMNWANLSRQYLRERSDWVELCAKCHKRFDSLPAEERSNRWEQYTGQKAELLTPHDL